MQGLRQFSFEPLTQCSELSPLFNKLYFVFLLDEEIIWEMAEDCPQHDKAVTSKAKAVDMSEVLADVST